MTHCSKANCPKKKSSMTATSSVTVTDRQLKALYPLVSHRIIPLAHLAEIVDMSTGGLRKAAQRLGVTEDALDLNVTFPIFKRILKYSYEYDTGVMDYITDVMSNNTDF